MSLLFFGASAPDPWRRLLGQLARIEHAGVVEVALKEAAQILRAAHAQLGGLAVDCLFHFRWTGKRQRDVSAGGVFFGGHLAELLSGFADVGDRAKRYVIDVAVGMLDHQHGDPDEHLPRSFYRQRKAVKCRYHERIEAFFAYPLF